MACIVSCAAIPAAHQTSLAERAIDAEQRRRLGDPAHAAERTYRLTLASALLDKAREQAAKGRFQSARDLADEAKRLAGDAGGYRATSEAPPSAGGGA